VRECGARAKGRDGRWSGCGGLGDERGGMEQTRVVVVVIDGTGLMEGGGCGCG